MSEYRELEFVPVGAGEADTLFLEFQKFMLEEICEAFGASRPQRPSAANSEENAA